MIDLVDVGVSVPLAAGGARALLTGVTLALGERRIAVVGANGSGKSTLLRLLNGLVTPTTGRVTVDGLDTVRQGAEVRRRVGFVFTDPLAQLLLSTPAEDVELSLGRAIKDRAARRAMAERLLAERGLAPVAHQSIYDLSGGERQLVALTSVLACAPAVVVADEPTTLLDLRNRNLVIDSFLALDQQLVYATHDLDFAAAADRAVLIQGGAIAADGRPADVIDAYRRSVA